MKSGLEGRNNKVPSTNVDKFYTRLNEVRPRRPEQLVVSKPVRKRGKMSQ